MNLGVTGNGDSELTEFCPDQFHQFVGKLQSTFGGYESFISLGRVATQGNDVISPLVVCLLEIVLQIFHARVDACQMGCDREMRNLANMSQHFQGRALTRATGAIRAREETRIERRQPTNIGAKSIQPLRRLGREQLERDRAIPGRVLSGEIHLGLWSTRTFGGRTGWCTVVGWIQRPLKSTSRRSGV